MAGMNAIRSVFILAFAAGLLTVLIGCDAPVIDLGAPPVRVEEDREGSGRIATAGDIVTIDYEIFLPDGTAVLSDTRFRFQLGAGAVISGIDEAVEGMRVGGHRTIRCPPHRHWGRQGYGNGLIPPNTVLTIELSLLRVEGGGQTVRR